MGALFDRLAVRDRKFMLPGAMVCAEMWNINRDREKHPEPFAAADFLPELAEERRRRLEAEELAKLPPSKEEFEAYKTRLLQNLVPPRQSAANRA